MINNNENNNNIEVNGIEEEIKMTTNENIATDTVITGTQTTIENNVKNNNNNLEGIKMTTNEIKAIEAKAVEAATAAAQAKNAYDKISREKKAIAELNKLFSAQKGVASALNQIASNSYKKAAAELAIAHLNTVVTKFFTEKKLAAHEKKLASQNAKIAASNAKIAIYREKLVAANDKLAAFNEAEIVAAALAVLNGTAITPVVAPVVVAPAPVVETVDVDAVLAKVNTAVIAARDAASKEHMLKSVKKFAALRDEINAPIFDFDHISDVNVAIEMIVTKARNAADMAAIDDYIVSEAAQESAIMAEIEAANFVPTEKLETKLEEEILSCGGDDDVEDISEEDHIAAMSDWNTEEVFDPKEFLEEEKLFSSEEFEKETETATEENTSAPAPNLENKTVVGTVAEPKTEEIPAALAALNNLEAELLGEQVEEPKVEVKAAMAPVDPIAEARRKMRELMAKKAGKPVATETAEKKTEETVEKKGSAEEPKAPTKEDEALAREAEAYQKAKAIEEEIYASFDPKTKQYGAYMPKTMKLQKNAQEALYNAFHSETTDTHVSAASIWDTIGDETPEIIDPYAPYVAPKAIRTETRYLNVKEYENGEMALPEDSDEAKTNLAGANYDDIMAACGY